MGSPFSFPPRLVSSLLGKWASMSPPLYTTVLTDGSDKLSWPVMSVGGYCCRSEEKWWGSGERGRHIIGCHFWQEQAAFGIFAVFVQLLNNTYCYCENVWLISSEIQKHSDPSQAHLFWFLMKLFWSFVKLFGHAWGGLFGNRHKDLRLDKQHVWIRHHILLALDLLIVMMLW